jgi:hypothetical protein
VYREPPTSNGRNSPALHAPDALLYPGDRFLESEDEYNLETSYDRKKVFLLETPWRPLSDFLVHLLVYQGSSLHLHLVVPCLAIWRSVRHRRFSGLNGH